MHNSILHSLRRLKIWNIEKSKERFCLRVKSCQSIQGKTQNQAKLIILAGVQMSENTECTCWLDGIWLTQIASISVFGYPSNHRYFFPHMTKSTNDTYFK